MAALSVTPANVAINSANTRTFPYRAGEAIAQGQAFYLASDGKAYVADNADVAEAEVAGIAMTKASADEDFISGVNSGSIKPGATMTKGVLYYLGSAGAAVPYADLSSADYVVALFRATSTSEADIEIRNTGILL